MRSKFTIAALLLTLTACAEPQSLGKPPVPSFGNMVVELSEQPKKYSDKEWWKNFGDETLNELVSKALENNQNKKIIESRLLEARALRESAFAGLFPQITLGGAAKRGKEGVLTQGHTTSFYDTKFDASYELDLFGQTNDKISSFAAQISAIGAEYDDFKISLIAEIAREYTDGRNYQMQGLITKRKIANLVDYLKLEQSLVDAGLGDNIKLSAAAANLRAAEEELPKQLNLAQAAGLRILVLTGEEKIENIVKSLETEKPIPNSDSLHPLAFSADIIGKRPDVVAAEKKLESATALYTAQTKEIFPKLTISALFGFQEPDILPGGKIWSLGGNFAAPLLNFGKIEAQTNAAKEREKQAFHAYKQKILEALADIHTTLTRYHTAKNELTTTRGENDAYKNRLTLVKDKYKSGLVNYKDVIAAEQNYLESLAKLSTAEASQTKASIAVYKSLAVH